MFPLLIYIPLKSWQVTGLLNHLCILRKQFLSMIWCLPVMLFLHILQFFWHTLMTEDAISSSMSTEFKRREHTVSVEWFSVFISVWPIWIQVPFWHKERSESWDCKILLLKWLPCMYYTHNLLNVQPQIGIASSMSQRK